MQFNIYIDHDRKLKRLSVERVSQTKETEQFKVTFGSGSFTIQSNKPLLVARGLKTKKINWKIVEGGYDNYFILEKVIKSLEQTLGYSKRR
jgi:hypothetical protein